MTTGAFRTANATVAAHGATLVTPSDATVIPICRSLYVGTTGNINARMADGQTVLFTAVAVGIFPIQVDQVLSTSTTASNIVALY
jgi:hypothetical protein